MASKKKDIMKLISNFFTRVLKYKEIFKIVSIILFCLFIFKDLAWATPDNAGAKALDDGLNAVIQGINILLSVLTFLITPLIMLAGWLLSPDWTYGDVFNLRAPLHSLWVLVSNIVYVIFAIALIAIAFMNIFSSNQKYVLKDNLPKILVGILIVPFTWFIVSAFLSISNILTASVIQLPIDTIMQATGNNEDNFMTEPVIPKKIVYNANESKDTGTVDSNGNKLDTKTNTGSMEYKANGNFYATDCNAEGNDCISIEDFLRNSAGGAYNLLSVYAYGIFKIQDYQAVTGKEVGAGLTKTGDIVKKLIFGAIFFVIFAVLIIAIVIALFYRAVVLWIFIIFSPLFGLIYFLTGKAGKLEEKIKKFNITKFISLAMVPVYVSAALAFGLMFVSAAINGKNSTGTETTCGINSSVVQVSCPDESSGEQTFKFGDVTLKTIGVLTKDAVAVGNTSLNAGKGIIGTIIINVLALVILWLAVMAALGSSEITEKAVAPIAEMGGKLGKFALTLPKYMPLPIPGGSFAATQRVADSLMNIPNEIASIKAAESNIAKKFNLDQIRHKATLDSAFTQGITSDNFSKSQEALRGLIEKQGFENSKEYIQKFLDKLSGPLKNLLGASADEVMLNPYKMATLAYAENINRSALFSNNDSDKIGGNRTPIQLLNDYKNRTNSGKNKDDKKNKEETPAPTAPATTNQTFTTKKGILYKITNNATKTGGREIEIINTTNVNGPKITLKVEGLNKMSELKTQLKTRGINDEDLTELATEIHGKNKQLFKPNFDLTK